MKIAFVVIAGLLVAFPRVDAQTCPAPQSSPTGVLGILNGISSALFGVIGTILSDISSLLNGLTGKLNMKEVLSNYNIFYRIE
jgi:hypothetical protein